jgi:DNA invertase Pin-like site-specific DNA recombinase
MAAYCRLSKDDGESKISESIENQMKMIREYVSKSDDLEIADIYIDDGNIDVLFSCRR